MDKKKTAYQTKEHIRDTLLSCGKSFLKITSEIPMCRTALMNIVDLKNYSFDNYEKIIAYCRVLAPHEDWSYTSLEELIYFYTDNIIPPGEGLPPSYRQIFLYQGHKPRVDKYILLCNIKSKMEAENLCSK